MKPKVRLFPRVVMVPSGSVLAFLEGGSLSEDVDGAKLLEKFLLSVGTSVREAEGFPLEFGRLFFMEEYGFAVDDFFVYEGLCLMC